MADLNVEKEVAVERTVGSVYRALGLDDADEMERKARLVSKINDTIRIRELTRVQAAEIVGMDQTSLSGLLRGRFD